MGDNTVLYKKPKTIHKSLNKTTERYLLVILQFMHFLYVLKLAKIIH